jgi:hemoglobin
MDTLYSRLGSENLLKLVERFYELVFASEKISHLFQNDKSIIIEKQFQFLSQFLGGPQLYSERYGHPKMRMRHIPHRITNEAKEEWLTCMNKAISSLDIDPELKVSLYNVFPAVAQHMVNS